MNRKLDRTGHVYGTFRVVGPGSKPGLWAVECQSCGKRYEKDAVGLRVAKSHRSISCRACSSRVHEVRPPRHVSDTTLLQFDYRSPTGVLAQRLICRGLVAR